MMTDTSCTLITWTVLLLITIQTPNVNAVLTTIGNGTRYSIFNDAKFTAGESTMCCGSVQMALLNESEAENLYRCHIPDVARDQYWVQRGNKCATVNFTKTGTVFQDANCQERYKAICSKTVTYSTSPSPTSATTAAWAYKANNITPAPNCTMKASATTKGSAYRTTGTHFPTPNPGKIASVTTKRPSYKTTSTHTRTPNPGITSPAATTGSAVKTNGKTTTHSGKTTPGSPKASPSKTKGPAHMYTGTNSPTQNPGIAGYAATKGPSDKSTNTNTSTVNPRISPASTKGVTFRTPGTAFSSISSIVGRARSGASSAQGTRQPQWQTIKQNNTNIHAVNEALTQTKAISGCKRWFGGSLLHMTLEILFVEMKLVNTEGHYWIEDTKDANSSDDCLVFTRHKGNNSIRTVQCDEEHFTLCQSVGDNDMLLNSAFFENILEELVIKNETAKDFRAKNTIWDPRISSHIVGGSGLVFMVVFAVIVGLWDLPYLKYICLYFSDTDTATERE